MEDPLWLQMLRQYQDERHLGLTLSFLVGAQRSPLGAVRTEQASFAELAALLTSMALETPDNAAIRIAECPKLNHPVAAFLSKQSESLGQPVSIPGHEGTSLYAWQQYLDANDDSIGVLAEKVWSVFKGPICAGFFSYDAGTFHPFTDADVAFIERSKRRREGV